MSKGLPKRSENFSEWYNEIVKRAGLAENSAVRVAGTERVGTPFLSNMLPMVPVRSPSIAAVVMFLIG